MSLYVGDKVYLRAVERGDIERSKVNWDFAPFFQVNGFKAAGAINPVGMER